MTGNGERINARAGDADYKTVTGELGFRYSLINQGFDVDTVSLRNGPIDTGLTALVIADPKTAFTDADLVKIRQYISGGGNLVIAGEPGGQNRLNVGESNGQNLLNPIVKDLGVTFTGDRLIRKSQDFAPDFVLASFSPEGDAFGQNAFLRKEKGIVSMPGVTGISSMPGAAAPPGSANSFHSFPLLVSNAVPVAVALTRKIGPKEQRIMIIGDADFMSTAEMQRHSPMTNNFDFITGLFSWPDYGEFPVDASRLKTFDGININRDGILLVRIVFFCILPLLLLAGGTILLITRKRR